MSAPAIPLAEPSPIEAAREAVEHTRRNLFPFRFERWLALGFVAFLDQCGRGGGGSFRWPMGRGGESGGDSGGAPDVSGVTDWVGGHGGLLVGGAPRGPGLLPGVPPPS